MGALKYDELDDQTRARTLVAAAAVEDLIGKPLASAHDASPVAPAAQTPAPAVSSSSADGAAAGDGKRGLWAGIGVAVVTLALAALFGWQFVRWSTASPEEPGVVDIEAAVTATVADSASVSGDASAGTEGSAEAGTPETAVAPAPAAGDVAAADEPAAADNPAESDEAAETDQGPNADGVDNAGVAEASAQNATAEPPAGEAASAEEVSVEDASIEDASVTEEPAVAARGPVVTPQAGDTRTNEIDGAVYVFIPGGEFTMGSDEGRPDEGPAHVVEVDAFWLMRDEVSNAQYAACVAAGACSAPASEGWDGAELAGFPVTGITWEQATEYALWAGGRLPTEAEWELAARGDDGRSYPWGEEPPSGELVNFNFSVGGVTAVGSYPDGAGPFGNLDMAGNVEEWVADRYDAGYYSASPSRNPQGAEAGPLRTVRGGSYFSNGMDVRTFAREKALPNAQFDGVGFRVAAPVE